MFQLNLTSHFQTYLLSTFIVPKFLKFCNHLNINSNKSTMFIMILNYFQSTFFYLCQKLDHFFIAFLTTFYVYFTMLSFVTTCDWLQSIDGYLPLVSLISKHSKDNKFAKDNGVFKISTSSTSILNPSRSIIKSQKTYICLVSCVVVEILHSYTY